MNGGKVKKLRKYILKNLDKVLIIIRNEFGEKTEGMGSRQIYQNAKRLYKSGKLKIT